MAIISDGTTEIDLGKTAETIGPGLEKTSKRTGGGNIRSITSGERFKMDCRSRGTPAVYRSLLDLMKNGASSYFFTPTDTSQWTDLYPLTTWPMNANIFDIKREWDNRGIFYIKYKVESTSYVT